MLAWHGQIPACALRHHIKSGVEVYACDPRTEEEGTRRSEVQGHPRPDKESEDSLGCLETLSQSTNVVFNLTVDFVTH